MAKALGIVEVQKTQTMMIIMAKNHLVWEVMLDNNSREGHVEHRLHDQITFGMSKGCSHEQIFELFEKNTI